MTIEEMDKVIQAHCDKIGGDCDSCPIADPCEYCVGKFDRFPKQCEEAYKILTAKEDIVNHPKHYTNGGMECIDEMIMIFGKQTVMHFCLCNAWKYRYRAVYKNGDEDMKKSHWYMAKYKELRDGNYQ